MIPATSRNLPCPACRRTIGSDSRCPYCDTEIPRPLPVRLLRWSAGLLVLGGFTLLLSL